MAHEEIIEADKPITDEEDVNSVEIVQDDEVVSWDDFDPVEDEEVVIGAGSDILSSRKHKR